MSDRPIRVLIADDQALVRAGFRLILEAHAGIEVVAEAADGQAAVALTRRLRPDVVLMDIRMPGLDGLEATRQLMAGEPGAVGPAPRIIILTTFDLDQYVYAAIQAGASGFLLKDVTPEHLLGAVQTVAVGDALLAPSITRRLVARYAQPAAAPTSPDPLLDALTTREMEVFRLLARGMSNGEIADTLVVSEATVKTHVAGVLSKLNVHNRAQAVVAAYEVGVVQAASMRGEADGQEGEAAERGVVRPRPSR